MQPFSIGPASCMGQNLGKSLMRIILASMVDELEIKAAAGFKPIDWDQMQYYLRPELPPLMVTLGKK